MANVKIGSDGSIIKDNVKVESDSGTIIREDGTIELAGTINVQPSNNIPAATPPASPLERDGNGANTTSQGHNQVHSPTINTSGRTIAEIEYDIQVHEARIKNAIPLGMIIATIILVIIALMGMYILFVPAIVTGIMVFLGINKKTELEDEKKQMCDELARLKNGAR